MGIREAVKRICVKQLDRVYQRQLAEKRIDYHQWVAGKERNLTQEVLPEGEGFLILCQKKGEMGKYTISLLAEFLNQHPQAQVLYGDEDVKDGEGIRKNPWYKPNWSPDTFLSQFYVGSIIAIRNKVWNGWMQQEDFRTKAEFLEKNERNCGLVPVVYFESCEQIKELVLTVLEGVGGFERGCEAIYRIPQILFHAESEEVWQEYLGTGLVRGSTKYQEELVSVIIPSKDNPDVLKKCLNSIKEHDNIEVIVVDNGSSESNRAKIEELQTIDQYIYHPMEFNFSQMCNLGVKEARGEYLLFLNDDMELCGKNWLSAMLQKAMLDYVGAVGLKLYYPDSGKLQHAGIVNLPVGPVHKMQFGEDENTYYFGRNRGVWNCIAVTGACLMIKKEKYLAVGGLKSALQVAYNDVELAFALYEAGYQNVVIQEEYGYHHESLSRGDDVSREKRERLLRERSLLYQMHPKLKGKDPYYPVELSQDGLDSRIIPAYFSAGNQSQSGKLKRDLFAPGELRADPCLMVNLEQRDGSILRGYGVVLGDDNACYDRYLVLSKEQQDLKELWTIETDKQYRQDLEENMPDQKNVALCGFDVALSEEEKRKFTGYFVGVIAVHKVSKLKLINWSGWQLRGTD